MRAPAYAKAFRLRGTATRPRNQRVPHAARTRPVPCRPKAAAHCRVAMEGTGARFARSAPRPGSLVNWRAVVAKGPPAHSTEPAYPCCFPALQLRDQRERIARDVEKVLDEPRDEGTHAIAGHVPISDPPTPPGPVTTPPGSSTTGAVSHADPISQQPPSGGNEQGNGVRRDDAARGVATRVGTRALVRTAHACRPPR